MLRPLLTCSLVLLLVASPAVCAAPEGVLHSAPGSTVDGTPAINGMHVSGGQVLQTPHGQFTDLLTRGSSLRLLGDTKLQFNGESAELVEGGVALTTTSRFALRTGCAEIIPTSGATRYAVQLDKKTVFVSAVENEVTVRARKSVQVASGKTVAVYCGAPTQAIVFTGTSFPAKAAMAVGAAGATGAGLSPMAAGGSGLTGLSSKPGISASSPAEE